MNNSKVSGKSIRHFLILAASFFVFAVGTSQCFAQSQSATADPKIQQEQQYLEMITRMFYTIEQNYVDEVDLEKLYEGAISGMLDSMGDPYTTYMNQDEWRSLTDTTVGNFGGVGLTITKPVASTPDKPAYVQVVSPLDGTPGAKAGIQSGDYIIAIDGTPTESLTMNEVLGMLRGTIGESVTVTIRRKTMEFEKTLVRALIENPSVSYAMIRETGYIRISEFSSNTAKRVQEALDSFSSQGYKSLIIDLRNNGGGLLSTAVDIADKFISRGRIVSTKSRIPYENTVYNATPSSTKVKNIPVIVLINGGSASASEILSGALKDNHAAYLVGERSYGKGSVQIPSELMNNDGFKITVARYYTPSDTNIDKIGIPPDREVKFPDFSDEEMDAYERIMNTTEIADYVEAHPDMTEADINNYAISLRDSYNLEPRVLRKIIRNEVDRTKSTRIFDLDYDIQLLEALNILETEDVLTLTSQTKTVKEIVDEENAAKESAAE